VKPECNFRLSQLPRIDDLFDQLAKSCVFDSLDLAQGYHQIRISEDDVPKSAFNLYLTNYGQKEVHN
jgi:hypothetical protein